MFQSMQQSGRYSYLLVPTRTYSYLLVPTRTYSYLLVPTRTYSYLLVPTRTYSYTSIDRTLLCSNHRTQQRMTEWVRPRLGK